MAYVVGTLLIVLVFVAVPLQIWGHSMLAVRIDGTIHGYLYFVYLILGADLVRRTRLGFWWIVAIVFSGFVPGLAFVTEHYVNRRVHALGLLGPDGPAVPEVAAAVTVPGGAGEPGDPLSP
jgi:integral membrane protein